MMKDDKFIPMLQLTKIEIPKSIALPLRQFLLKSILKECMLSKDWRRNFVPVDRKKYKSIISYY